jgi:hypothetical protein
MSELSELDVVEVSLVDKAANKRQFLVMKSQDGGSNMNELILNCEDGMEDVLEAVAKVDKGTADILKSILADDKNVAEAIAKAAEEIRPAMSMALKALATVKKDLGTGALEMIAKALEIELPTVEVEVEKAADGEDDEAKKAIKKAAPGVVFKEDGSPDFATVPEEVRPMLEMLWKQNEESVKKATAMELTLKAERDDRLNKEFITKAEDFKHLSVEAAKFGPILKNAFEKLDQSEYDELMRVLKAADKGMSEVFKETGSENDDDNGEATATQKLEKHASTIAKRDGISLEVAFVKAMDEYPDLAAQERSERNTH